MTSFTFLKYLLQLKVCCSEIWNTVLIIISQLTLITEITLTVEKLWNLTNVLAHNISSLPPHFSLLRILYSNEDDIPQYMQ